jgi:hypothetical protein
LGAWIYLWLGGFHHHFLGLIWSTKRPHSKRYLKVPTWVLVHPGQAGWTSTPTSNSTFLSEVSYSDQIKSKKCYIWTQRPGFSLMVGYL